MSKRDNSACNPTALQRIEDACAHVLPRFGQDSGRHQLQLWPPVVTSQQLPPAYESDWVEPGYYYTCDCRLVASVAAASHLQALMDFCPVSQQPFTVGGPGRPFLLPCGHSISHIALSAVRAPLISLTSPLQLLLSHTYPFSRPLCDRREPTPA